MDNYRKPESWRSFFLILSGKTNGAHSSVVERLKAAGHTEVRSPEGCDYLLVFCPNVSRVGADISSALNNIPKNKPAVLVVMHHTFDHDYIISESRSQVKNLNVLLTVDCLFHSDRFLDCKCNDIMFDEMGKFLGVTLDQIPFWRRPSRKKVLFGALFLLISRGIGYFITEILMKRNRDVAPALEPNKP